MPEFIVQWITAVLATFLITPAVRAIAFHYRLLDNPRTRYHPAHTHTGTIPRAGGLALYLGLIVTTSVFIIPSEKLTGILIASGILVFIGLLDDRQDVNPYVRLFVNGCATLIILLSGVTIPFVTNPINGQTIRLDTWQVTLPLGAYNFTLSPLSDGLTFIWIMWTINIIGWSAGIEGQMPGFVSISAFILGILSLRFSIIDQTQTWVTTLAFLVSGIFAGFLPWNFYPQKIMPGYGGKTLAGLLLALLGILSSAKFGTALLVLGVPMVDAMYTLFRRFTSRSPLVHADRQHLHHKLLDIGWGKRKIALFYWGISAILGIIALSVNSRQKLFALLLTAVGIGMVIVWLNYFSRYSNRSDQDSG